jgi:hypothetical protein
MYLHFLKMYLNTYLTYDRCHKIENMFISLIEIKNILKFSTLKLILCLLFIYVNKDHKMHT